MTRQPELPLGPPPEPGPGPGTSDRAHAPRPEPRAGATLQAKLDPTGGPWTSSFVEDEHDDHWSIVARTIDQRLFAVQKYTADGPVAAVFDADAGTLVVAPAGEGFGGDRVKVRLVVTARHRWEFVWE